MIGKRTLWPWRRSATSEGDKVTMSKDVENGIRETFRRRDVLLLESADSPRNVDVRRSLGVNARDYARVHADEIRLMQSRGPGQPFNPFSARPPQPAASPITVGPA